MRKGKFSSAVSLLLFFQRKQHKQPQIDKDNEEAKGKNKCDINSVGYRSCRIQSMHIYVHFHNVTKQCNPNANRKLL